MQFRIVHKSGHSLPLWSSAWTSVGRKTFANSIRLVCQEKEQQKKNGQGKKEGKPLPVSAGLNT
jgi:hypothetical protein